MMRFIRLLYTGLPDQPPTGEMAPKWYRALRRNVLVIMLSVSILPMCAMGLISHLESQRAIKEEIIAPLKVLVSKSRHSFELFLAERKSAVSFIASAYSYEQLADQKTLASIFRIMRHEYGGFVDLGLIDVRGVQVSYVGPYELEGKEYSDHQWFQEVMIRGAHVSDVFMGYRSFPHYVMAVKHESPAGGDWILRATIDTSLFDQLIGSMGLEPLADAFIINNDNILQTDSKHYGDALDPFPITLPTRGFDPTYTVKTDEDGREILFISAPIPGTNFILVLAKPGEVALKAWNLLRNKMILVFLGCLVIIIVVVTTLATRMVRRIEVSDMQREAMLHNMEHANKLASIGRLAAGVAHEINNPMAIINEKAGLMEDLLKTSEFEHKERFHALTQSIIRSVQRCSTITHRLLGFARRMDVQVEKTDVNEVLTEVVGFLEKEALHRNIELNVTLAEGLPFIETDHGQLQQVFLNILNNAFNAVQDGGEVSVKSYAPGPETVAVDIEDNGCGMSEEVRRRIFEPFFSTKGAKGTGLGLSITHGIIHKLGGTIDITSQLGEGSRFTVLLPIISPQITEPATQGNLEQ